MKDNDSSLFMLRTLLREGNAFKSRYDAGIPDEKWKGFSAEISGWIERVKLILRHIFYNIKFHEDYVAALQRTYDYNYCDVVEALEITREYIISLGQLLKYGYVKDPTAGMDNSGSKICFVAMWFSPEMEDIYNYGIYKTIADFGYEVVRIDKQQHNDRIDAKIFEVIRKARFLVADFTGNREGVYYEAGFASGQGIPVIHTCRSDFIDKLHFDVKTINTIVYDTHDELAPQLRERVDATIGRYKEPKDLVEVSDDMPF